MCKMKLEDLIPKHKLYKSSGRDLAKSLAWGQTLAPWSSTYVDVKRRQ